MAELYFDYCVAFIDILGFKSMTSDFEKIKEMQTTLNEAIDLMKNYNPIHNSLKSMEENSHIISMQGADSMFFMFPHNFTNVYLVIRRLCIMQFKLATKGVYLRGAITSGAMYIDEDNSVFFGEAWNKAVLSEKNAVSPRIILENSLVIELKDRFKAMNEGIMEFALDDDGVYSLSSYGIYPVLESGIDQSKILYTSIFNYLEKNIEQNKHNQSILQKYLWILKQIKHDHNKNMEGRTEEIITQILNLLLNI